MANAYMKLNMNFQKLGSFKGFKQIFFLNVRGLIMDKFFFNLLQLANHFNLMCLKIKFILIFNSKSFMEISLMKATLLIYQETIYMMTCSMFTLIKLNQLLLLKHVHLNFFTLLFKVKFISRMESNYRMVSYVKKYLISYMSHHIHSKEVNLRDTAVDY